MAANQVKIVISVFAVSLALTGLGLAILRFIDQKAEEPPKENVNLAAPQIPGKSPPPGPLKTANLPASDKEKNPPLKMVPVELELSPADKPNPIIYVAAPEMYTVEKLPIVTGLLRRELYRQSVLLAARDELGLIVRDATLHELPPPDLPIANQFDVNARFVVARQDELKIDVGPRAASRLLWRAIGAQQSMHFEKPVDALAQAEALSRTDLVAAIKKAGHRGKANPLNANAKVPESVESRMVQMTFTSQYAACRLMHETIRTEGESEATLGALSRVYANLGMLTDTQWDSMTWTFKARALLYAERLRQREPNSPWGHWNRAYALALTGLHAQALEDLKAAEEKRGKIAVPEWAGLIDALCRFDTVRLANAAKEGPYADTAKILQFITLESYAGLRKAWAVGYDILQTIPECYRIHDSVVDMGGANSSRARSADGFEILSDTFAKRVAEIPGIPEKVLNLASPDTPEPELVQALREAGRSPEDRGQPSLATLGQFAQEVRVPQINAWLWYYCRSFAGTGDEYFGKVKHLVADHHLLPYFESYLLHPERDRAEYQKRIRGLKIPELTYKHNHLLGALQLLGPTERQFFTNIATEHGDHLYSDDYRIMRHVGPETNSSQYAHRLLKNSPYAPIGRASLIEHDWNFVKAQADEWEREAQHAEVLIAFGRQYVKQTRWADAERVFLKSIEFSPDLNTYRQLADVYKAQKDMDKWLAALESYLKDTNQNLGHARVRSEIAEYFMAAGDFEKAHPYAEAAAQTYSEWGMQTGAKCAEGRGEWDKAEEYMKNISNRYANGYHSWFFWCLRTGRGDRAEAQRGVEAALAKAAKSPSAGDLIVKSVLLAATGKADQSTELLVEFEKKTGNGGVLLMALGDYEAAGNIVRRDRIVELWPKKTAFAPVITLLRGMKDNGSKNLPTRESIDAVLAPPMTAVDRAYSCYAVARFLLRRSQGELALHYLRESLKVPGSGETILRVSSSLALRELEKK